MQKDRTQFYAACWHIIKSEVVNVLKSFQDKEHIDEEINTGFTTLVYKKGAREEISKYRPISLLN